MDLTTLIYASSAVVLFSPQDLLDLLRMARLNNARLDITGMLLYKGGNFLQALEGPEKAVRHLYAAITRDPRHRSATKLLEYQMNQRQFANWTMGFSNLDGAREVDDPAFTDILNQPLDSAYLGEDPTRAQKILATFCKNM